MAPYSRANSSLSREQYVFRKHALDRLIRTSNECDIMLCLYRCERGVPPPSTIVFQKSSLCPFAEYAYNSKKNIRMCASENCPHWTWHRHEWNNKYTWDVTICKYYWIFHYYIFVKSVAIKYEVEIISKNLKGRQNSRIEDMIKK